MWPLKGTVCAKDFIMFCKITTWLQLLLISSQSHINHKAAKIYSFSFLSLTSYFILLELFYVELFYNRLKGVFIYCKKKKNIQFNSIKRFLFVNSLLALVSFIHQTFLLCVSSVAACVLHRAISGWMLPEFSRRLSRQDERSLWAPPRRLSEEKPTSETSPRKKELFFVSWRIKSGLLMSPLCHIGQK